MADECFICFQSDERRLQDVEVTSCCKQRYHKGCYTEWLAKRYYCAMCRSQLQALKPLPDSVLDRIKLVKSMLEGQEIYSHTATVADAGELVEDSELRSAIQRSLGDCFYYIERRNHSKGFQQGRLVEVKYGTSLSTLTNDVSRTILTVPCAEVPWKERTA